MKKLLVAAVLFLIVALSAGAVGCDPIKGPIKGSGAFYDPDTQNRIEFKVNLVPGKTDDNGPIGWTDLLGSIHLDDETAGVKVRGGPWMRFWDGYNSLTAWDVHVNGEKCDYLEAFTGKDQGRTWFWIMLIDDNAIVYDCWGWLDEIEWEDEIEW